MKLIRNTLDWVALAGIAFVLFVALTAPAEVIAKTVQLCLFGALVLFCYKKRSSTLIPAWHSITGGKYVEPAARESREPDVPISTSDSTGDGGASEVDRHQENQAAA